MTEKRTSLQIYKSTKTELVRVRGKLEAKNGKQRSFNDVIKELILFWKENQNSKS